MIKIILYFLILINFIYTIICKFSEIRTGKNIQRLFYFALMNMPLHLLKLD